MSNPFQLNFTLKQHTPIIHFQHEQEGATLRATEVKPKLDRFIMEKLTGKIAHEAAAEFKRRALLREGEDAKPEWKNWLVGKGKSEHVALDYKMRITDAKPVVKNGDFKLITEKIDQGPNSKKPILSQTGVKVELHLFSIELKEEIEKHYQLFFLIENFGTRQSKGWGCYTEESMKCEGVVEALFKSNLPVYILKNFQYNSNSVDGFYQSILKFWRVLKSGNNFPAYNGRPAVYIKAAIFKYMTKNNLRWDKRWMKQRLNEVISSHSTRVSIPNLTGVRLKKTNHPNDATINHPSPDHCNDSHFGTNSELDISTLAAPYRFGRAMLGLAEHLEFRANNGFTFQFRIKGLNGIERFKAPVTFKVFENKLFAIVHDPKAMLDKEFQFEVQAKKQNLNPPPPLLNEGPPMEVMDTTGNPKILKTPINSTEFSLENFLDEFFPCQGFERLKSSNYKTFCNA